MEEVHYTASYGEFRVQYEAMHCTRNPFGGFPESPWRLSAGLANEVNTEWQMLFPCSHHGGARRRSLDHPDIQSSWVKGRSHGSRSKLLPLTRPGHVHLPLRQVHTVRCQLRLLAPLRRKVVHAGSVDSTWERERERRADLLADGENPGARRPLFALLSCNLAVRDT